MKVDTISDTIEKQIVIGLITSNEYTKQVLPLLDLNLLHSNICKIVGNWCIEYFKKYSSVPGIGIKLLYNEKIESIEDRVTKKLLKLFIKMVSKNYSDLGFNIDYVFKRSKVYFKKQSMILSIQKINNLIEHGKIDQAEEMWLNSMRFSDFEDLGFDPLNRDSVKRAFEREENYRVKIGTGITALDKIAGKAKSGWLCCFIGPMKRGKTFALWHTAIHGLLNNLNVVFVSFETEEEDNAFRFWSGLGSFSTTENTKLDFPYFVKNQQIIKTKKRTRPLLNSKNVINLLSRVNKMTSGKIRIKRYPMNSATVSDIEKYLNALEVYENFTPHLLCVDYLGIIKAPKGIIGRDKYDINSQLLKSLAQKKDCVCFTGHQGTRASLSMESLSAEDTSEDIRVIANIDMGYGINQNDLEKELNQNRISVISHRHKKFTHNRQARNLIQLEAGQFSLDSRVNIIRKKENKEK